jgi:hypothetical protein
LDTLDAFIWVCDAIAITINEDKVPKAYGLIEAEVKSEVMVVVSERVKVGGLTKFTVVVGGFRPEGKVEEACADAGKAGGVGVDAVFVDVIIRTVVRTIAREGVEVGERGACDELRGGYMEEIVTFLQSGEEVEAIQVR